MENKKAQTGRVDSRLGVSLIVAAVLLASVLNIEVFLSLLPCMMFSLLVVDKIQAGSKAQEVREYDVNYISERGAHPLVSTTRSINAPAKPATISFAFLGRSVRRHMPNLGRNIRMVVRLSVFRDVLLVCLGGFVGSSTRD